MHTLNLQYNSRTFGALLLYTRRKKLYQLDKRLTPLGIIPLYPSEHYRL